MPAPSYLLVPRSNALAQAAAGPRTTRRDQPRSSRGLATVERKKKIKSEVGEG